MDILVIGGGPSGAWSAMLLAERGFEVTIWDRAVFPRDKACGEFLNPGAVRILNSHNALDGLPGMPICGARIFDRKGTSFDGSYHPDDGMGFSMRRTILDNRILDLARSAGATVVEGASYQRHRWNSGTVVVSGRSTDGPLEARCRILVGADGVHSAVARTMGVVRPSRRHQRVAFVSHFSGIAGLEQRIEMHAGKRGCVGIGPGPGGLANVTVVVRPSDAKRVGADLISYIESYPVLRNRFDGADWEGSTLRTGTFGHAVSHAIADGVMLVGDSAQFVDPFTGEGLYFALRGAELAAEVAAISLGEGSTSMAALAPYERQRRAAFKARYSLCDIIQRFLGAPAVLSYMASRMRRHPDLADMLVRTTGDVLSPRAVFSPFYLARLAV